MLRARSLGWPRFPVEIPVNTREGENDQQHQRQEERHVREDEQHSEVQCAGGPNAANEAQEVLECGPMPFEVNPRGLRPRCVNIDSPSRMLLALSAGGAFQRRPL